MSEDIHSLIRSLFKQANRIAITSHIRPDGDAIGSVLGLGLALKDVGKSVQMVMVDGIPSSYRHLTGSNLIQKRVEGDVDLRISVDSSDLVRLGGAFSEAPMDLNIDHHITNLNFARINLVEPQAVATSDVIAKYLPAWGLPITKPVAEALLTGIVSDTIGFRTSNMNPEALRMAANLMERGADLPDLYLKALVNRSYKEALYWGAGLSRLNREDSLIWTTLTLEDRKMIGYNGNDDADLNAMLSSIKDADVSVLFIEQKDEHVKVSWRARPGLDVSRIALGFGGGGHPAAAGADIPGKLEDVQPAVLQATRDLITATKSKERESSLQ